MLETKEIPVKYIFRTVTKNFTHLVLQYTINSKKVEVAVKRIISGEDVKQRGALANPNSLDLYYNIPELTRNSAS